MHNYDDAIAAAELIDECIRNQMNMTMHPHSDSFVTMLDYSSVAQVTLITTTDNENNNAFTTNDNAILELSYNEQQPNQHSNSDVTTSSQHSHANEHVFSIQTRINVIIIINTKKRRNSMQVR